MSSLAQRITILAAIFVGLLAWTYARAGTVSDPFTGTPVAINGTPGATTIFEAENFNKGGEGIGYHDPWSCSTAGITVCTSCQRSTYRPDGVLVCPLGTGQMLSYLDASLWVEYTIQVNAVAAYTVELLASLDGTCANCALAAYEIELDGARYPLDPTKSYSVAPLGTGGWAIFLWVGKSDPIPMVPGVHRLRIRVLHGWFNWDSIRVKYAAGIEWQQVPVWKVYP